MIQGFELVIFAVVAIAVYAMRAPELALNRIDRPALTLAIAIGAALAAFLFGIRTSPFMVAVYFIVWWTVLFAILPFGVRSQAEDGVVVEGSEPGAPTAPLLMRKVAVNTIVSTALFAVFWTVFTYKLVSLNDMATLWGLLK
jgi:predicted secreted protein